MPVLAVTVQVLPPPVTALMNAPLNPPAIRVKAVASTPVTALSKVTVQETVPALVGLAPASTMDVTVGAVTITLLAKVNRGLAVLEQLEAVLLAMK